MLILYHPHSVLSLSFIILIHPWSFSSFFILILYHPDLLSFPSFIILILYRPYPLSVDPRKALPQISKGKAYNKQKKNAALGTDFDLKNTFHSMLHTIH